MFIFYRKDYGGDPDVTNIYGVTPISEASRIDNDKCFKILFNDNNARMSFGDTPLH
jgi:ankyrin repeat protein